MNNIIFKIKSAHATNDNDFVTINKDYSILNSINPLGVLSKTNIFIGENNSGKSRFLRSLFSTQYYSLSKDGFESFYQAIRRKLPSDPYREYSSCLEALNDFYTLKNIDAAIFFVFIC